MYVNEKMRPVETVPGIRGGKMGERSGGRNSSMIYLIYYKNLCKCYSVHTVSTAMKKGNSKGSEIKYQSSTKSFIMIIIYLSSSA
jgi:hypothetical protein